MLDKNNPYAAPTADVTPPTSSMHPDSLDLLPEARSLSLGVGISWIKEGWALMKPNLGIWILMSLAYMVFQIVMSIIPIVGGIVAQLLSSVIIAGFLMAAKHVDLGGTLRFDFLFEGFKNRFAPLLGLGALMLGVYILMALIFGGGMRALMGESFDPEAGIIDPSAMLTPVVMILMLVGLVVGILLMLAFAYATHLVALNNVPVFESIKQSFKGTAKNILPLIVYAIIASIIVIISAIPLGLGLLITIPSIIVIISAIPLFLGLFIIIPLFIVTSYISYKHIFLNQ